MRAIVTRATTLMACKGTGTWAAPRHTRAARTVAPQRAEARAARAARPASPPLRPRSAGSATRSKWSRTASPSRNTGAVSTLPPAAVGHVKMAWPGGCHQFLPYPSAFSHGCASCWRPQAAQEGRVQRAADGCGIAHGSGGGAQGGGGEHCETRREIRMIRHTVPCAASCRVWCTLGKRRARPRGRCAQRRESAALLFRQPAAGMAWRCATALLLCRRAHACGWGWACGCEAAAEARAAAAR